jgi:hypothetical protein
VDPSPLETAVVNLARKAQTDPAGLDPSDLHPLRELVGDGALEYVLVLVSFHCITRVADLLGAKPEMPAPLRRFEPMRRMAMRAAGLWLRTIGMAGRSYLTDYEQAQANIRPIFEQAVGRTPSDDLKALSPRPQLIETLQLILEEQLERSSLPRSTLVRVHRIVEEQLLTKHDSPESNRLQDDPIESFVAIGTRNPYRATAAMVDALRETGFDDLAILDLAVAVADANMWARLNRLLELPPEIYYL